MSNGDDAMTSAEFAKLMGAYPEPSGNPLPSYGGFMDNSPANFSWVQNNDYFGAEDYMTDEELLRAARNDIQNQIDNGTMYAIDEQPRNEHCDEDGNWEDGENLYTIVTSYAQYHKDEDKAEKILWKMFREEYPQYGAETFEATPKWECDACGDMHDDEDEAESCCIESCDHTGDAEMQSWGGPYRGSEFQMYCNTCGADGYGTFGSIDWSHHDKTLEHEQTADTDLTPTDQMNNSIGQVVPVTNPMELPTNLIEVQAGGGPEGQITPDVFSGEEFKECVCGNPIEICDYCEGTQLDEDGEECGCDPTPSLCEDCEDDDGYDTSCIICERDLTDSISGERTSMEYITCTECGRVCCSSHEGIGDDAVCPVCNTSKSAETFEAEYMRKGWKIKRPYQNYIDATKENPYRSISIHYNKGDNEPYMMYRTRGSGEFYFKTLDEALDWLNGDDDGKDFMNAETFEAGTYLDIDPNDMDTLALNGHWWSNDGITEGDLKELGLTKKNHWEAAREYMRMKGEMWGASAADVSRILQRYGWDAEMDIVADGMAVISNIRDDTVGVVEVIDDEDDDEMVEISIQDENLEEIGSFTLDDGHLMDDYDDYLAESKTPSLMALGIGAVAAILAFPYLKEGVSKVFSADNDTQEVLENDPELVENPDIGDLDPAQYEELVVESTGYAVDIIPMGLDGSFMGSRFAALPTERYVDYNDPGIGAHTDIAMNRDENFLEPEMAMVQAAEGDTVVKETQAPGQSPYFQMGQEPADMNYRVIKETHPVSLDPAVKPFIPQSMAGYTGNANTPPSVYNKMFNIGVLGQTPLFVPGTEGDIGTNHLGSRDAQPDMLGLNGSVGGPLSDQLNQSYTDGQTSMSLAQWSIENTVSQSSDTEAVVIDRSSGAMKRIRRV